MTDFLSYFTIGLTQGLVYGLLALGMVLIYKGTRVLNLAHPYFGLQTAFLCWWLTAKASFPPFSWLPFGNDSGGRFAIAVVISLALAALNGLFIEKRIMRELRHSSRLIQLVATIALAQGTAGLVLLIFNRTEEQAAVARRLPGVFESLRFEIGTRSVTSADLLILVVTAAIGVAAAVFFTRSKFGVAVRAVAENREAARLLGISADRVSAFVWIVGSLLAGVAGILITMKRGSLDVGSLSTGFLIRGLAAALVGGLTSLPGALVGGVFIGVMEAMTQWQTDNMAGGPELFLFVVILLVLTLRPQGLWGQREQTEDKVAFVPAIRDLPARLRGIPAARGVRLLTPIMIAFVVGLSLVTGPGTNGTFTRVAVFAMVGVSLTILMGYSGQMSLGHWGLCGVGAFSMANLYTRVGMPFFIALFLTVLVGMALSLVIGLPALRIKGLYLAVATLAFNLFVEFYLFKSDLFGGSTAGVSITPPKLGPVDLDSTTSRPLFLVTFALLLLMLVVARNLLHSRTGRGFLAIRENEKAAATLGVGLTQYRLLAFAVSGGMAALAGALYGMELGISQADAFPAEYSLALVAMVLIGGLGSLAGPIYGAFIVFGLSRLLEFENRWIVPIGTGVLLLLVITRAKGGIAGLVQKMRHGVVETLASFDERGDRGSDDVSGPAAVPATAGR